MPRGGPGTWAGRASEPWLALKDGGTEKECVLSEEWTGVGERRQNHLPDPETKEDVGHLGCDVWAGEPEVPPSPVTSPLSASVSLGGKWR